MSNNRENNTSNDTNRFDDDIFLALFRKAAHDYIENDLLNDLTVNQDDAVLSDVTDKKIRKMINSAIRKEKSKKVMKRLPRIIAIVLIVITVCSITVMSVEALRVSFLNLFTITTEKITDIEFHENQTNGEDKSSIDLFAYIPDGYELSMEDNQEQETTFIFTNEREENIIISIFNGTGNYGMDTEDAEYGEILINDDQAFYSIKNGLTTLIFTKKEYAYSISGSVDLTEITKIAENIK